MPGSFVAVAGDNAMAVPSEIPSSLSGVSAAAGEDVNAFDFEAETESFRFTWDGSLCSSAPDNNIIKYFKGIFRLHQ